MTDSHPVSSPFHDRLIPGTVFDSENMIAHPSPSFAKLELLPLAELTLPEESRLGVVGKCWHCTPNESWIWRNEHWHVTSSPGTGMPFQGSLTPNAHVLLDDAPRRSSHFSRRCFAAAQYRYEEDSRCGTASLRAF